MRETIKAARLVIGLAVLLLPSKGDAVGKARDASPPDSAVSPAACVAQEVSIEKPVSKEGRPANVGDRPEVIGKVRVSGAASPTCARVVVVIHPLRVSNYYVQPIPTVTKSGRWEISAYVGEEGKNAGEKFEIRAFANPTEELQEGVLGKWPDAEQASDVVMVTKRLKTGAK